VLSGRLHLDEVEEHCGLRVPEGEYETLAGYVLAELGRIPAVGDRFTCDGWRVEVFEMDRNRVSMVRIEAPLP
jgi:CBS domain containing-hemolysin-like protein